MALPISVEPWISTVYAGAWLGEIAILCIFVRIAGGCKPEWPACAAVGILSIYFSFLCAECLGLRFDFEVLILIQCILAGGIGGLWRFFPVAAPSLRSSNSLDPFYKVIVLSVAVSMGLGYLTKPLAGPDQYFRWSFLADQIFRWRSLSFYPPVRLGDLERYFWCDGFPPLVSTQLAWTHLLARRILAAPGLGLLLVSVIGSTYFVAEIAAELTDGTSRRFALIAFACNMGILADIRSMCDTTVLIPSVLGMVYYLLRAIRDHSRVRANIALAALFAVLSSQAREYGPAYGCVALVWIMIHPSLRKTGWLFAAVLLVGGFPWYARNWILTGNPMWSNPVANLPTNDVHTLLMATYRRAFGVNTWNFFTWIRVLAWSIFGVPFAFVGLWGCVHEIRKFGLIIMIAVTSMALFFVAVGSTCSDPTFAFRVYGPGVALLCVPAAMMMQSFWSRRELHLVSKGLVCLMFIRSVCDSYLFPRSIYVESAIAMRGLPPADPDDSRAVNSNTEGVRMLLDGKGILVTDDVVLASRLSTTGYRVWMVWDPRIQFSFDPNVVPEDARLHLLSLGVTQVSLLPTEIDRKFLLQSPFWGAIESKLTRISATPLSLSKVSCLGSGR